MSILKKRMSTLHKRKIILSLCDASGSWPEPYRQAGYEVRKYDIREKHDVRLLPIEDLVGKVYGVLSAPPCTHFCLGGAHLWSKKTDWHLLQGLSIVDACVRISVLVKPKFWALENPPGRLDKYLGPPSMAFQPYEYGDPYSKRTYLWGNFNTCLKKNMVDFTPDHVELSSHGFGNKQFVRSITPEGFAQAFFDANH
jgi:hypothetical protein